jgi:hypothetical protein
MDGGQGAAHRASRDREAIERITGRSVSLVWPDNALPPGTRVRIVQDSEWAGPWLVEFCGVIDIVGAPEPNNHELAYPGEFKYCIQFDEAQQDHSGDGPYSGAQIWGRYVQPVADRDAE